MAAVGWTASTDRLVYNRRGKDQLWDAYTSKPDGSDERCLTCTLSIPGPGTHSQRGGSSVSPDGRYVLGTIEGKHVGEFYGAGDAEPGRGTYNDVWLMRSDGSAAWQLTHYVQDHGMGTMWADFDRTGTRIVWAQMTGMATPLTPFGTWQIKIAKLRWSHGTPSLTRVQTLQPQRGRFYEPYGFTPDGRGILLASDYRMPNVWYSQIWIMNIATGAMTRISPDDVPHNLLAQLGPFSNYNEFAQFTPDGSRIVFGRTRGDAAGMDYWTARPDGSDVHRLTFMGESWSSQHAGYGNSSAIVFDPHNPNLIFAGRGADATSYRINGYLIDISQGGLTARYYSDSDLSHLLNTRLENPSDGLDFEPAPVPGLPARKFGVRWTGMLTAPASGTYTFAVRTDSVSKLTITVDGSALSPQGQSVLSMGTYTASVTMSAGQHRFSIEYANGGRGGYEQVLWKPPAGAVPAPIPVRYLSPG